MDRLKSLSLKKALSLIVTITAAIVIILSVISVRICSNIHDQILLSHAFIMEPTVISPEQDGSYTISAREDNIDDTVTDDGKGFSVQDLTQAVNYFYKGKNEKEHFGIGLTICKILAEKHGGSISLANAANCGAMVTVKIKSDTSSL